LQEIERQLAAKEASLPHEDAVTLEVRMPDGSCRGCRFLKSDKLQVLMCKRPELNSLSGHFLGNFYCLFLLSSFYGFEQSILTAQLWRLTLQFLFDFIDIGRGVKPGTYKLVS